MVDVFEFDDYRKYLEARIADDSSKRGYQARLATAAGCKGSFLSQVLHSHINITPDHAAGLCRFWNFNEDETDWFFELVSLARAGVPELKKICNRRLKEIEKRRTNLNERFKPSRNLAKEAQTQYYSSWYWSAIHMVTCVPGYGSISKIASRFKLRESLVRDVLNFLEKSGLVKIKDGQWKVSESDVHLPKSSALNAMNHVNWRHRSIFSIQNNEDEDSLHYTAVHALSAKDISKIQEILIKAIKQTRDVVNPSPEEEVICITCDVFKI